MVSPKRFPSSSSIPNMSRHGSPRSVPTSARHQLHRAVSQMDMATAAKLGQQNFAGLSMLTPLPTYTPHIVDEYYTDYSSPEPNMGAFAPHSSKNGFMASGRLTPQTPEPYAFNEPLSIADPFDPYSNAQWSDDGQVPIGLGFENDMQTMMMPEANMRMWTPELDSTPTSMEPMPSFDQPVCRSPSTMHGWAEQPTSVSPPQIPHTLPHTRGVPSLSMSEASAPEYDPPEGAQEEWANLRMNQANHMSAYMETIRTSSKHPQWEDIMIPRTTSSF
ncbi:hypothetical protein EJ04DRAFT_343271 [Polyplosphaeria fusca]|uniref:Uncharacterized protein n=1 Tax=Polyplosphaeria fusca TaxID=682080 RepID=A0A9P4QTH5_9PLEO|nr:hypothetical protein EJ04DRAFT_343271 [Polyplosphaeria fusca]